MQKSNAAPADIRNIFKRWPAFYVFITIVFGPMFFSGLSPKRFLTKYPAAGKTLNLGSGPRTFKDAAVVNIDIYAYPGVALVADIVSVPLSDGSAARIICDQVLEHAPEPMRAVREIHRLLAPGAVAYIATPFLYPFHFSPSDYQRWSTEGLRELFKDFEMVEIPA